MPGRDDPGRSGARGSSRRRLGRSAGSFLAGRCHRGDSPLGCLGDPLQRHSRPRRRSRETLHAPVRRVRDRSGARRRADVCGAVVAAARDRVWDRFERRSIPHSLARRAIGAARVGRVAVAARRRARGIGRRARRAPASHGEADRPAVACRFVRAIAHGRLSDAVSAVCRSARPRAAVAPGLSRQLQHRLAARAGRTPASGVRALGYVAGHRSSGARRVPCRRSPGHAVQRSAVRAVPHAAGRPPGSGRRGGATRGAGALDAARARRRRPRADCVPRSRRRAARRGLRDAARLRAADRLAPSRSARSHSSRVPAPKPIARVSLVRSSGVRKATGSFYTPQPIADYLVRRTLGPLVQDAAPDDILRLRVVDPSMGSGAFLVAACRYLADAYEAALLRTGGCSPGDFGEGERVATRRTIAERCLYGVDVNPMAVQLARLSLWLATLAADRPLTFLDHHLQTGDSLLGTWLSQLRRAPNLRLNRRPEARGPTCRCSTRPASRRRSRRRCRFASAWPSSPATRSSRFGRRSERWPRSMPATRRCRSGSGSRTCGARRGSVGRTASVPASAFGALSDVILAGVGALPDQASRRYLETAAAIARSHRLFHWELEFPEVFFGRDGRRLPDAGFDAVIGNPPWDMIRADAGSSREPRAGANGGFCRDPVHA